MIAYRAETSIASILVDYLGRKDDALPLLREIYQSAADISPNDENQTLTVKLHHLANAQSNKAVQKICVDLNNSETFYPGTNYRMVYELVSN